MNKWKAYLLIGLLYSQSIHANTDITLLVLGSIRDDTCNVSLSSSALFVNLGDVSRQQFIMAGGVSLKKQFNFRLENCGADVQSVKISFTGESDTQDPTLLALSSTTGQAQGVAIEILDGEGTRVSVNQLSANYLLSSNVNEWAFYARYRTTGNVSAGTANSIAAIVLEYQ